MYKIRFGVERNPTDRMRHDDLFMSKKKKKAQYLIKKNKCFANFFVFSVLVKNLKLQNKAGKWESDAPAIPFILFHYFHTAQRNYDRNVKLN